MIAVGEADSFNFGAGLYGFGHTFYGQVFNTDHRVAVLQFVAVGIEHFYGRIGCFSGNGSGGVPFVVTLGAGHQALVFVGQVGFTVGAKDAFRHKDDVIYTQ